MSVSLRAARRALAALFFLTIGCILGCRRPLVTQYRDASPIRRPVPWDLRKLVIATKSWKVEGCDGCVLTVKYDDGRPAWETSVRHGKFQYPLWGEIRISPDANHILVPYFRQNLFSSPHYEIIDLNVAHRSETVSILSERWSTTMGWRR